MTVMRLADEMIDDEQAATVVSLGSLYVARNVPAKRLVIEKVDYDSVGYDKLELYFDRQVPETIMTMGSGAGCADWREDGGFVDRGPEPEDVENPWTGDIMINTALSADTYQVLGSYRIAITFRLKGD